jgi:hypothetical protein
MTRRPPEEQLAELERKEAQLKARIQKKRAEVKSKNRRQDTRRKIIAGAIVLEHAEHDQFFANTLEKLLKKHVTRPEDRKLFDL